jgi:hypothetical protein
MSLGRAGLGALQFQFRHVFYLEFLYWLSLVGLIAGCVEAIRHAPKQVRRFWSWRFAGRIAAMAFTVPCAALGAAVSLLIVLRIFQNSHAHQLIDRYLAASREPVQLVEETIADEILLRPEGEAPGMGGQRVRIERTPFQGYYFDATIDSGRCPLFAATIAYKKSPYVDLSRNVLLMSDGKPGSGHIIFPAMNSVGSPAQPSMFEGVKVSAQQRRCVLGLQAIADNESLPLPLWLQLPPDWRSEKLYQTRIEPILPYGHDPGLVTNLLPGSVAGFEMAKQTIHPFGDKAWETIYEPAIAVGAGVQIVGVPSSPYCYAAISVPYRLSRHAIVAARGRIKQGGATIGVLNADGRQWAASLSLTIGDFVALLDIPETNDYRVVVANDLPGSETNNDVEISDIGLIAGEPSEFRVK